MFIFMFKFMLMFMFMFMLLNEGEDISLCSVPWCKSTSPNPSLHQTFITVTITKKRKRKEMRRDTAHVDCHAIEITHLIHVRIIVGVVVAVVGIVVTVVVRGRG